MGRLCETLKESARLGEVPAFLLKVRGKNKSQKFAQEYHRVKNLRIMNPGYNPHYFYWPQPPCLFWLFESMHETSSYEIEQGSQRMIILPLDLSTSGCSDMCFLSRTAAR